MEEILGREKNERGRAKGKYTKTEAGRNSFMRRDKHRQDSYLRNLPEEEKRFAVEGADETRLIPEPWSGADRKRGESAKNNPCLSVPR